MTTESKAVSPDFNIETPRIIPENLKDIAMGRDPTKVRIIKQVTNNVSFGKEPSPIKEVLEQARKNGS